LLAVLTVPQLVLQLLAGFLGFLAVRRPGTLAFPLASIGVRPLQNEMRAIMEPLHPDADGLLQGITSMHSPRHRRSSRQAPWHRSRRLVVH
jgi:hypothetical protein